MKEKDRRETILEAFRGSEFKWRTSQGLARDTGIPFQEVAAFLERSSDVVRAKKANAHGQTLYSLKSGRSEETAPRVFLFQSVVERYDLREKLVPGVQDTWYATRYRREMRPGDFVFFWLAGNQGVRGVYGWGKLTTDPYQKPEWDSYGVDVQYEVSFSKPILAASLEEDNILRGMLIFRAPQATNFLLSRAEAESLIKLVRKRGDKAPSIEGLTHV
ncbi:EVE domain-containing protein [Paraburkholderia sp. RL17-347-BIC-D]|uniref:EVE domain-containing protein n=1 Tax=Paraburkholderia sp. RL17-347-BIC-D TaxID=3031632 RepID=UPI0038BA7060